MDGQGGGGGRVTFWIALIGLLLGLVLGVVISSALSYRGGTVQEVTRVVEVTREVEVARPIEVTRTVIETRVVEVTRVIEITRIVEIDGDTPTSSPHQNSESAQSDNTGGVIIGVLTNDGRASTGTHTVALFPKTRLDAAGEVRADRDKEIIVPVNGETAFAEAHGLAPGSYVACVKSLLHTATVGEIDIVAGEITRVDLFWPAEVTRINVECILDS